MRKDVVVYVYMNEVLKAKSLSFVGINDRLSCEGYCNLYHGAV
jgi:hypothetical protein